MNDIEKKIDQLQKDVNYIKSMLEDLTLTLSSGRDNRSAIVGQMETFKKMFANIPGISPEIKQNLDKIFDQAGGVS